MTPQKSKEIECVACQALVIPIEVQQSVMRHQDKDVRGGFELYKDERQCPNCGEMGI